MVSALVVISLVLTGLVAGTLTVGLVAVRPAMHSLPPTPYVMVKQAFDISYPRMMKLLQITNLIATIALAVAAGVTGATACAVLAGIVAACVLTNILVTVRGDLPINNAMATWQPESPPADWREQRARWDFFNSIRTTAAVIALVLLALAATTQY
ncbi:hypothetical protein CcI156_17330 [Frankia sp. CcI156]|uniref:DUF1772 domain-containing protein n=1 Tax=Frankia TaxID=1854 RepID=UPI0003CFEF6F|nr:MULTISPECIES: DUF1772 domain-containing protein [Frankia]ETA01118.1 putative integral membrane protein [Frankia sp. CcI6]KDA42170.1 putative integral membrane protein [Frankia sp. BMG5.23]KEZ35714.1 putative integral membrane protein [Frankia sp. CeD]KFB03168.1 putative integral membrane protein [Frankia sp. Allo2]OAA20738.1 putative integral membrane protein [Frankia casuarinae]